VTVTLTIEGYTSDLVITFLLLTFPIFVKNLS